jgi:hypothetical protein
MMDSRADGALGDAQLGGDRAKVEIQVVTEHQDSAVPLTDGTKRLMDFVHHWELVLRIGGWRRAKSEHREKASQTSPPGLVA